MLGYVKIDCDISATAFSSWQIYFEIMHSLQKRIIFIGLFARKENCSKQTVKITTRVVDEKHVLANIPDICYIGH